MKKKRAQKFRNWIFSPYCPELPIWPKIENPYGKLVWGTLFFIYLLCDLIVHNFVLQKQTFVSEFFNHPYRNSSRKYKWLQLLEVFNSCNIQILYGFSSTQVFSSCLLPQRCEPDSWLTSQKTFFYFRSYLGTLRKDCRNRVGIFYFTI